MTSDLDIYRTANLLMKQRGALEAKIEAAQRADELLAAGDMEGRSVWLIRPLRNIRKDLTRVTSVESMHTTARRLVTPAVPY